MLSWRCRDVALFCAPTSYTSCEGEVRVVRPATLGGHLPARPSPIHYGGVTLSHINCRGGAKALSATPRGFAGGAFLRSSTPDDKGAARISFGAALPFRRFLLFAASFFCVASMRAVVSCSGLPRPVVHGDRWCPPRVLVLSCAAGTLDTT